MLLQPGSYTGRVAVGVDVVDWYALDLSAWDGLGLLVGGPVSATLHAPSGAVTPIADVFHTLIPQSGTWLVEVRPAGGRALAEYSFDFAREARASQSDAGGSRDAGATVETALHVGGGTLAARLDPPYDAVDLFALARSERVTHIVRVVDAEGMDVPFSITNGERPSQTNSLPGGWQFVRPNSSWGFVRVEHASPLSYTVDVRLYDHDALPPPTTVVATGGVEHLTATPSGLLARTSDGRLLRVDGDAVEVFREGPIGRWFDADSDGRVFHVHDDTVWRSEDDGGGTPFMRGDSIAIGPNGELLSRVASGGARLRSLAPDGTMSDVLDRPPRGLRLGFDGALYSDGVLSPVVRVDPSDWTTSVYSEYAQSLGVSIDEVGRLYFAALYTNTLFRFDPVSKNLEVLAGWVPPTAGVAVDGGRVYLSYPEPTSSFPSLISYPLDDAKGYVAPRGAHAATHSLPDLRVDSIATAVAATDDTGHETARHVDIVIANDGAGSAAACALIVQMNRGYPSLFWTSERLKVPALAPGERATISLTWDTSQAVGAMRVYALVDPGRELLETTRDNNEMRHDTYVVVDA